MSFKKQQHRLRLTVSDSVKADADMISLYFDNDPLGKIFYAEIVTLIKQRAATIPETFKIVNCKKP